MKRLRMKNYYDEEWKKNPNAVYVGRGQGSKWGNPFPLIDEKHREGVIELYRAWLIMKLKEDPHFLDELIGKDLVCFCPLDKHCHADVLIEFLEPKKPEALLTTPFYTSLDGYTK